MNMNKLNLEKSFEYYEKSKEVIPGGILGIRRPYNFVPGEYPVFFDRAQGGTVIDVDGNEYVDMLCAYGPIIIGHREEEIDNAVVDQIRMKGFCFSLTQEIQNHLADKMIELIPSAEMCVFLKTGSDATTLAVRIARAKTGRDKIIRCGYHGWHDWCVEVKGGIPEKLYEDVYEVKYNDLEGLEVLLKDIGPDTAGLIITPVGHPLAHPVEEPAAGFLEGAKKLCEKYGVVLIFDEIRSGFRYSLGGAQKVYQVTPHLSVFGKAMANGYPISAVVGKKEIMKVVEDEVFVSSTFFPNSLEQVAALKTIEIMERDDVLGKIKMKGHGFCSSLKEIVEGSSLPVELSGAPFMPYITFPKDDKKLYKELRNFFYTAVIRQGVFLQPYHHGYVAYRHTEENLARALTAVENALAEMKNKYFK